MPLAVGGVLSCGARRVGGRVAESFLVTEAFPCYHAANFPCCGNSPPGGRHVSVIMDRGADHQAATRGPALPPGRVPGRATVTSGAGVASEVNFATARRPTGDIWLTGIAF